MQNFVGQKLCADCEQVGIRARVNSGLTIQGEQAIVWVLWISGVEHVIGSSGAVRTLVVNPRKKIPDGSMLIRTIGLIVEVFGMRHYVTRHADSSPIRNLDRLLCMGHLQLIRFARC